MPAKLIILKHISKYFIVNYIFLYNNLVFLQIIYNFATNSKAYYK